MAKIIYLQVAKVASLNNDMTTNIERSVITLEEGKNFNNFVKLLHVQNYLQKEPPKVIKAVETKDGKVIGEIDFEGYQKQVEKALYDAKTPEQKQDYKAESEKQRKINEDLLARLEALEGGTPDNQGSVYRDKLEEKASELNITFRSNIGDEKLLLKIQEVEPEYKV